MFLKVAFGSICWCGPATATWQDTKYEFGVDEKGVIHVIDEAKSQMMSCSRAGYYSNSVWYQVLHASNSSGQHTRLFQDVHNRGAVCSLWQNHCSDFVLVGSLRMAYCICWSVETSSRTTWRPVMFGIAWKFFGMIIGSCVRSTNPSTQRLQQRWRMESAPPRVWQLVLSSARDSGKCWDYYDSIPESQHDYLGLKPVGTRTSQS